jgi:hypothetical protein
MAQRDNLPVPAFFATEAWRALNHTKISTSNCGNPSLRLFGFGPVVSDGFGIGYIIKDSSISFCLASKHRQGGRLRSVLRSCVHSCFLFDYVCCCYYEYLLTCKLVHTCWEKQIPRGDQEYSRRTAGARHHAFPFRGW